MSKVQLEALLQLAVGVTMVVVAALVGFVRSRQLCGCVKALVSPRQRPVGSARRVQEMLSINVGRDDTVARTLQTPLLADYGNGTEGTGDERVAVVVQRDGGGGIVAPHDVSTRRAGIGATAKKYVKP